MPPALDVLPSGSEPVEGTDRSGQMGGNVYPRNVAQFRVKASVYIPRGFGLQLTYWSSWNVRRDAKRSMLRWLHFCYTRSKIVVFSFKSLESRNTLDS